MYIRVRKYNAKKFIKNITKSKNFQKLNVRKLKLFYCVKLENNYETYNMKTQQNDSHSIS